MRVGKMTATKGWVKTAKEGKIKITHCIEDQGARREALGLCYE